MIGPQSIWFPAVGPSLNDFYGGCHWTARKRHADQWHGLVAIWAKKYALMPVKGIVRLEFAFHFGRGRKAYDASNCAVAAKLIEDGLVKAKILKGDGPRWVRQVLLSSHPRADETCTLVQIIPVAVPVVPVA